MTAVDMDQSPPAAPNPEAPVCPAGQSATNLFLDNLENTGSGNWTLQTGSGLNRWFYPQNPNGILDATYATSGTRTSGATDRARRPTTRCQNGEHAIPAGTAPSCVSTTPTGSRTARERVRRRRARVQHEQRRELDRRRLAAGRERLQRHDRERLGQPTLGRHAFVRESNGLHLEPPRSQLAGGSERPLPLPDRHRPIVDDYGWFIDDIRVYTCARGGSNDSPVADAGGPYTVGEGQTLNLNGSSSSDPDGDPLTYGWELDGDNDFNDASGQQPAVNWATLVALGLDDGPSAPTITLRVLDDQASSDTDTASLSITNQPPTANVGGPVTATPGQSTNWTFSATDPSPADQAGRSPTRSTGTGTARSTRPCPPTVRRASPTPTRRPARSRSEREPPTRTAARARRRR